MSVINNKPLVLIGENASNDIINELINQNLDVIILPSDNRLASPVSSHADMLLFVLDNIIFCNEAYYENNKPIFNKIKEYGYKINQLEFEVSDKYPNDVALNQAVLNKNIFGFKNSCAKSILEYADSNGYTYHSIKQGYAKCSTLILGDKAIISADTGIITLAEKLGVNSLKIKNTPEDITLDGYNYGFIGGASTTFEKTVFFFGDITLHSYGDKITSFCHDNGFKTVSLGKNPLCDIGGAIILPYINVQ